MSIGKISEFDIVNDDWQLYVERLEQYFIVNKIPTDLQVPTLITVMGAESYELLVNLCTPVKPKSKTFEEITVIMGKHLQPKPSALAERYKFRHRKQTKGESIAEYVAVLKKMSKSCDFKTWLEESLRDQLVCGISSEVIRQRLFAEDSLDFTKAYSLAVSMEAAEKDAAAVEGQAERRGEVIRVADCQVITSSGRGRIGSVGRAPRAEIAERRSMRAQAAPAPAERGQRQREYRACGGPYEAAAPAPAERGQRQRECRACGGPHEAAACKFARYVCRACNRPGHLRRVCPRLMHHYSNEAVIEEKTNSDNSDEVIDISFNDLSITQCEPIFVSLEVQGESIDFECDTGSAISCISENMYKKYFQALPIKSCNIILRYYTGECVKPLGVINPLVKYKDKSMHLNLYVIRNGKTVLLGRQWMAALKIQLPILNYNRVDKVSGRSTEFNMDRFSSRYAKVFEESLGEFTGGTVSIHVREGARPVYMRARPLAYALREPVARELDRLVRSGILTPVERSDWATPIVPVVKKDGNIRICADYKLTLNKVIEVDRYPLPRLEELLARLNGGQQFSKIDLSQAYAQFVLDESRKYTVINTHKGLFRYNRLVYGLASSPAIFQRRLEELFADLPYVGVFLDDIIISGEESSSHLCNLYKVFDRLQQYGLRVKRDKCTFFADSVVYLGHTIDKNGVHTCPDKIKAIVDTPPPSNLSELRSFIGMVMYYAKFVRNISTLLAPLYRLLRGGVKYVWSYECESAFENVKKILSSSEVLIHYSEKLPLILTVDASSVGVGAVLSHTAADGERPVAYASRSLSSAERSYSQIDREALAIVFGVRKFNQYLYGRKFTLRTDHKPLTYIFGEKVGIPVMAASRLQRWAVLLSAYNYNIEYIASKKNCADALSRLPSISKLHLAPKESTYVHFVEDFLPITHKDVKDATRKDVELSRVMTYVQAGWPDTCNVTGIQPYFNRRRELYAEYGCLMWGYRMIIPVQLRKLILKQLHNSHMGIVKTKGLARSYVWWPNIDTDIEAMCKSCETCAAEADAPPRASPQPWPYTARPWTRLHVDFLGPCNGKTFFVLIDTSSKWIEIFEMNKTNASSVIKVLRATFARFGLPIELVSDQGPPFTSVEFKLFLQNNGIRQMFSPVYHPASNGAAESAVKICKRAIKKARRDNVDVDTALQTFLLSYRNSVHSTTGETPAAILQKRSLRTRLDLLRGDRAIEDRVSDKLSRQVECQDGKSRYLDTGDTVWARQYGTSDKWVKGTIRQIEGSRRYVVDSDDGRLLNRHVDQIRRRSRLSDVPCPSNDMVEAAVPEPHGSEMDPPEARGFIEGEPDVADKELADKESVIESDEDPQAKVLPSESPPTRSKRIRRPVVRFKID